MTNDQVTAKVGDKEITIGSGHITKQADGTVTVQMGETIVMTAVVAATKSRDGQDWFPLQVDYRERASACGVIPGNYFRREGRPSDKEILTCRLTDRPIRPLFNKGWFNECQVYGLLLSADGENEPDVLSILGASAALMVSDIPWAGPLGAVRVARIDGKFVANPTNDEMAESDLDLLYVGNETDVVMYEGSADQITEADFIKALKFGQECCIPQIEAQKELVKKCGKEKRDISDQLFVVPPAIFDKAEELGGGDRIVEALLTVAKLEREHKVSAIKDEVAAKLREEFGEDKVTGPVVDQAFYHIQKTALRGLILEKGKRLDGRSLDTLRPVQCEVGVLPRTHGSALFTRGETQALVTTTLGTTDDAQRFDSYTGGPDRKQFLLHYNFPNYSVGETGRIMGPGRREVGHGALAERSLLPMLPMDDNYPYAVRLIAEILESNGSSSMASVCGGSLALMNAGVEMKGACAGISIGICTDLDDDGKITDHRILTDIMGWEDAFCDMDCKIAGSKEGITGFQLDLKLKGLPMDIMEEAIEAARVARHNIIDTMNETISEAGEMSPYAPRITQLKVDPDKIGLIIGPGGKNIKRIVEESGCEINIEDDGTVNIYSLNPEGMQVAVEEIEGMTAEPEVGRVYEGTVVSIKDFGCFVEFLPGKDGLCHISELSDKRVDKATDVVKEGDRIPVKLIGVDERGKVRLSRKAAMVDSGEIEAPAEDEGSNNSKPEREVSDEEPEVGKLYQGTVVTVKEYGAFVEFLPGRDGLCHVSELASARVKNVEDIAKVGDKIWVKLLEIDERGKVRLSRKAALEEREAAEEEA
ncbi:MAG: polyribonucleotide nucleotidyltransferase [Limisphaerales bacterium]|nr:MAG: polyribonucleotide nucleotidyltransferase [Limisphaerales bacterium]